MNETHFTLIGEGEEAFKKRLKVTDCPYQHKSAEAQWWRTGWYDERTRHRLGWLFAKYGLTFP